MKKRLMALAVVMAAALAMPLRAQTDPVVMEVGGQPIRQSEFMREFWKSVGENLSRKPGVTAFDKEQALREYAGLYAIFRAKVLDARSMGMDTAADLVAELMRNRAELATPYLMDSSVQSAMLREAYERNHYALHASHILVRVPQGAKPEDTLAAYERALELRKRILDGANFTEVAIGEARRSNPQAQVHANEGELNYFSAFDMVYPFENAAYSMKPGDISEPVRTQYGYHIIKLHDRVPYYGKVTLQHIWYREESRQADIGDAYDRLLSGQPFEIVARQSDDFSTANAGGYLVDASMSQLPHEYVKVLSGLKEGEFSRPFLTRYGWHIVRLVRRDTMPSFEDLLPLYKQRMSRDPQRNLASRRHFAETCRKRYGILDLTQTPVATARGKKGQPVEMRASLDEMLSLLDNSFHGKEWKYKEEDIKDRRPMVSTPVRDYNALDFAHYLATHQGSDRYMPLSALLYERYEDFLDSVSIAYADSQLEKEHPDFAETVEEYRRGLMIFNYNDKMIWTKALVDSVGFRAFYDRESKGKRMSNPDDSLYFWRVRARAVEFHVSDSLCLPPAKAEALLNKALKKNQSSSAMQQALLGKRDRKRCGDDAVAFTSELVEQRNQKLLADDQWQRGVYLSPQGKGYRAVVVLDILEPSLKGPSEARGYYLNAWQNEVERELAEQLREKYQVKVHWDVVGNIKY
ncbi:MAG: peptidylprolyl isomerase [Bacteroidales bacterium]|nr:peptidylprolyl isomerase [Bacteroidales bacterium]